MSTAENKQLVLVGGESGTGKSVSLMNIPNQDKWYYLNCEAGKHLPFKNSFRNLDILEPYQVYEAFEVGKTDPDCHGIIIDTMTFLLDMFESQYIIGQANTQKAWGDFAQYSKVLMQKYVAALEKPVIILAHTHSELNEAAMEMQTSVPVKGSLKKNGLEAYFSTVVDTVKMTLTNLEPYREGNSLLRITEDDEMLGFKHVFQTRLTKSTTGKRVRSPIGMFSRAETYMDNDAQLLVQRLNEFYGKP